MITLLRFDMQRGLFAQIETWYTSNHIRRHSNRASKSWCDIAVFGVRSYRPFAGGQDREDDNDDKGAMEGMECSVFGAADGAQIPMA